MTDVKSEQFKEDIKPYVLRGEKCELWGVRAYMMSYRELIGFIGFLNEQLEAAGKGSVKWPT